MITLVPGNLLTSGCDIIAHQVNCVGVMGAGIAAQIRKAYPQVYIDYMSDYRAGKLKLGHSIPTVMPGITVVSMCAQATYGRRGVYTNYHALEGCLLYLRSYAFTRRHKILGIPYGIGCGLAGGDWSVVRALISTIFDDPKADGSDLDVRIYKWRG